LTIASWLLEIEAGRAGTVRAALAAHPGVECRSEARGTLVVLTETPAGDRSMGRLKEILSGVPGVRGADLVTAFEEDDEALSPLA
jgi:nitrate reductase NapAB chaperone NapD